MNFFKRLSLLSILGVTMLSVSSCSFITPYKTSITQGTVVSQEAVETLQKGLTMEQVTQILGPPFGKDNFYPRHWEYVFYTTDKSFQPDAIQHIAVSFDEEDYLKDWQIIKRKSPIISDNDSFF